MIKILFFASLREQVNRDNIEIASTNIATVADVKTHLIAQGSPFTEAMTDKQLLVAINEVMSHNDNDAIDDGDTLAFFPPVTGG